jgi:hypothetical protein
MPVNAETGSPVLFFIIGETRREVYHTLSGKRSALDDMIICLINRWGWGRPGTANHNPRQHGDKHKFQ